MYMYEPLEPTYEPCACASLDLLIAWLEDNFHKDIEQGVRVDDSPLVLYDGGAEIGLVWQVPETFVRKLNIHVIEGKNNG